MLESPPAATHQFGSTGMSFLSPVLYKSTSTHLNPPANAVRAADAPVTTLRHMARDSQPVFASGAYPFPVLPSRSATPEPDVSSSAPPRRARAPTETPQQSSIWSDSDTSSENSDSLQHSLKDIRQASSVASTSKPLSDGSGHKRALQRKLEGIEHDMIKLDTVSPTRSERASTAEDVQDDDDVPPTPEDEEWSRSLHAGVTPGAMPPLPMLPVQRNSSNDSDDRTSTRRFSDSIANRPSPTIKPPPSNAARPERRSPLGSSFGMSSSR
ncbi:hypothetical protein OIV83_001603 [Microbotryomycetes sp. JL201]|nr:hypothetical protein OIV83_001603 [Microbotryomycetes sp. JL201]